MTIVKTTIIHLKNETNRRVSFQCPYCNRNKNIHKRLLKDHVRCKCGVFFHATFATKIFSFKEGRIFL